MATHQKAGGKKTMGNTATVRKISYGEAVAQRLAHDSKLMASIDQSMADVAANRVFTLEEFANALEKKAARLDSVYQSRSAD